MTIRAKSAVLRGIYLRGAVYWLACQRNKKRSFISLETGDLAEAIRRSAEIRGADVLPDGGSLAHCVDRYVQHCEKTGVWTAASVDAKGPVLRQWAASMGDVTPGSVTTDRVLGWYRERCGVVSASTAHGNLLLLQGFFRWCEHHEKCVTGNPVVALTDRKSPRRVKPPAPAARKRFCPADLRDRLIAECPREDLRFVLFCGFHAGMRFGEIVEARADWFDLAGRQIHLRKHAGIQFKDREERSVPMTDEFFRFLRKYDHGDGYMLHPEVERGRALYRWDFGRPFGDYMRAQGCAWVTPHVMRHTFASLLASAGVSIFHIAAWMGDGVRVVERHYAHLIPLHLEIERAFSGRTVSERRSPRRKSASSTQGSRRSRKG